VCIRWKEEKQKENGSSRSRRLKRERYGMIFVMYVWRYGWKISARR